jgi:hypothetical protein
MKKRFLFVTTLLVMSTTFYAQKIVKTIHKAPVSIYTFNSLEKDSFSISSLHKRLKLKSFHFRFVAPHTIDQTLYPLNFREIGERASEYVYNDHERYQNNSFVKDFIFDNDPTRWRLHRRENRIQPQTVNK